MEKTSKKDVPHLKDIYRAFGLRYDIREARKFLNLDKEIPRSRVNRELKKYFHIIEDEINPWVYSYTLVAYFRQVYHTEKGPKIGKRTPISVSFQSKTRYTLQPGCCFIHTSMGYSRNTVEKVWKKVEKGRLLTIDEAVKYIGNKTVLLQLQDKSNGYNNVFRLQELRRERLRKMDKKLENVKLFREIVQLPHREFNEFKDTGNSRCVPETLLYHLQRTGKNKKLSIEKLIKMMDKIIDDNEPCKYRYDPEDSAEEFDVELEDLILEKYDNDPKFNEQMEEKFRQQYSKKGPPRTLPIEEGKMGYSACDIIKTLEHFNCRGYLIDFHAKMFLQTTGTFSHHMKSFVGLVYNQHLYYCTNDTFVRTISERAKTDESRGNFDYETYIKGKRVEDKREHYIFEKCDLMDEYIEQFKKDKTVRRVDVLNGNIVKIHFDDKVYCANPEKSIMMEMLGKEFVNQSSVLVGKKEWSEYRPEHRQSHFMKEVQDKITKHGGKRTVFNEPNDDMQYYYDINKCRTDCLMNNRLGDYELFGVDSQIAMFDGKLKSGIYYVETSDYTLFNGSAWYSSNFINYAKREKKSYEITHQVLATRTLPADYFKEFVNNIVSKYPKNYKSIMNKLNGWFGKTRDEKRYGYIEPDFEMAVAAFWENNDEKIGFLGDEKIDKKLWNIVKGKLSNIRTFNVDENTQHYIVEAVTVKTLYENDLPIYNKVLENEYLRLYELTKKLGGRLIKFETDAVVIEGDHNNIELNEKIGGYKLQEKSIISVTVKEEPEVERLDVDTSLNWNVIYEDGEIVMPSGSVLITGLAGFGKSYFVKQLPEYSDGKTIRLGFTNVSCENLESEEQCCHTLNSYFGINCMTGKCSEKKINNAKKVSCIIITECFMIPRYIMHILVKIKQMFPHIKWILEGDPEQNRPVQEEDINWLNTRALYNICDGNMIKLTVNKRNNETENYHKILNGEKLENKRYKWREPQQLNQTKTNKMRIEINRLVMGYDGYFIPANLTLNAYSQDIYLNLDMPVMCVKNNKKLGIRNGKMSKVDAYDNNMIIVNGISLTEREFVEHYVVAYACTSHKIQGLTLDCSFNIYEWNQMSRRERYTAYSRCTDADNVRIVNDEGGDSDRPNYVIYMWKCKSELVSDLYLGHTNNYTKRKHEHMRACITEKHKSHNLNLYRMIRSNGGLENWECVIIHKFFAVNREAAEREEQLWINKMRPSLNMVSSNLGLSV